MNTIEINGEKFVKRCPDNAFMASIYRKKTFSGFYTKWDSFTPSKYKVNFISTFTHRCSRTYSSPTLLRFALCDVRKLLLQNGYPQGTINIKSTTFSRKTETSLTAQSPPFQQGLIIFLPHIAFESNQISKRLKSSVSRFYPIVNLKVIFLNSCRIKSLSSHKDRFQTSKVVYKASCWNWFHSYIAKTKRRLQEKVNSLEPWPNKNTHQLLLITSKPWDNIKWDHFQIIASRKSDKVEEAMFIQELNPNLTREGLFVINFIPFTQGL